MLFHVKEGGHIDALYPHIPKPFVWAFSYGYLGVQVFFVLSGFVIAHSMARDDVDFSYAARFLVRRSIRLDPPYWASMVLAVGMGVLSVRFVAGKTYALPSLSDVIAHVLYLPVLLERPLIRDVYWTLCLEIQFYVVFACIMVVVTRLRRRIGERVAWLGALVAMSVIALPWTIQAQSVATPPLFLQCWHFFILGVFAWWGCHGRTDRASLVLAVLYIAFVCALGVWFRDPERCLAALTAAAILAAGRLHGLTTWLSAASLQRLGAVSYSLYLTHTSFAGAFFRAAGKLGAASPARDGLWLLVFVAGSVFAAWLFQRAIEQPSLRLSRRVSLRPRAPSANLESRA